MTAQELQNQIDLIKARIVQSNAQLLVQQKQHDIAIDAFNKQIANWQLQLDALSK